MVNKEIIWPREYWFTEDSLDDTLSKFNKLSETLRRSAEVSGRKSKLKNLDRVMANYSNDM